MKKYFLIFCISLSFLTSCGGGDGGASQIAESDLTILKDGAEVSSESGDFEFLATVEFNETLSNCRQQNTNTFDERLIVYSDVTGEEFRITLIDTEQTLVYEGDFNNPIGVETFEDDEGNTCSFEISPYPYDFDNASQINITLECTDGCKRVWQENIDS